MRRRLGLLVSAVVTVTIPGVLAVLAILGHEHAVSATDAVSAASVADEPAVGPLPVAPAGNLAATLEGVSCVSLTDCAAVGSYTRRCLADPRSLAGAWTRTRPFASRRRNAGYSAPELGWYTPIGVVAKTRFRS